MLELKYINDTETYPVCFNRVSSKVVSVKGEMPEKTIGFILSREGMQDNWDYSGYNTVYREIDNEIQFSCDGSVYVEPEPDPIVDPEPYVPTLEEVKEQKKAEINSAYKSVKESGFDVVLSTGVEHFPLSDEDATFLFGKQFELSSGDMEYLSYQDKNNHCKLYPRADMQAIINQAFIFTNYQTTYRNNLYEWIEECEDKDSVNAIYYGIEIPEDKQSVSYKMYHEKIQGE